MKLKNILPPMLKDLTTYRYAGITYYLGCEVIGLLSLSSITAAMGRTKNPPKISRLNWRMELIPKVNDQRGVYLFTYEGIEEIVKNNNNRTCKDLRARLGA